MMRASVRFGLLFAVIVSAGVLVNAWAYLGEARVVRKELKEFPERVGGWQQTGSDQKLDKATMEVLRASDYLLRDYRNADGGTANFYVGYYATQRDGATYHSPLNCLPGSGWIMSEPGKVAITSSDGRTFSANKYVIQNAGQKDMLVYWYQGRGRSVASEYWGKIYTVIDSVRLRRSDGAMVRVIVPINNSEAAALKSATDLAAQTTAVLPEYVPD